MNTDCLNQIVARNVKEAMTAAGKNPSSMASATGIHRSTLTRRLTGNSDWSTPELASIAEVFGKEPADLMKAAA